MSRGKLFVIRPLLFFFSENKIRREFDVRAHAVLYGVHVAINTARTVAGDTKFASVRVHAVVGISTFRFRRYRPRRRLGSGGTGRLLITVALTAACHYPLDDYELIVYDVRVPFFRVFLA